VLSIYYIADVVAQVREFLADFFKICGVMKIFDDYAVCSFLFELICVVEYVVFFEVLEMRFLYVPGVVQFSLMTLFARLFVQYCSSSAMSRIRFIISPYLMTPWMKMGGGL